MTPLQAFQRHAVPSAEFLCTKMGKTTRRMVMEVSKNHLVLTHDVFPGEFRTMNIPRNHELTQNGKTFVFTFKDPLSAITMEFI